MTGIDSRFRQFEANLRMKPTTVSTVQERYRAITRRINQDFWGIESETKHSWYAGSYGRGTAISTSDIDIHVELPHEVYMKYLFSTSLGQNGPSRLLQHVKTSLQKTYSTTKLRGDGQVVVVEFSDGVKFEVVPVFPVGNQTYVYPDTHNNGSWKSMKPKLESQVFSELSRHRPGGLKKFCRMLRALNRKLNLGFQGQAIDAMAYEYWQSSDYANKKPYLYFDWHTRDFFGYWQKEISRGWVEAPGSNRKIELNLVKEENRLLEVIYQGAKLASDNENSQSIEFWRSIYGDKFPTE